MLTPLGICVGSGGIANPYSVCEHQIHILDWLWETYHDPGLALQGGLHDATEGYVVDLPSPVKREIPLYKRIEDRLQRVIFRRFDLPEDMDLRVHGADARMLCTERAQCMSKSGHGWTVDDLEPLPVKLVFYPPTREVEDLYAHKIIDMHRLWMEKKHALL